MVKNDLLGILGYVLLTGALVAVFYGAVRLYYLSGVMNLSEVAARRKTTWQLHLRRTATQKTAGFSYWLKEMKLLWRTPSYFNNCLLINLVWPLLIWIVLRGTNIQYIFDYFKWSPEMQTAIIWAINLALAFLIAGSNSVAVTSVSREGKGYFVMKYLPLSFRKQLRAKLWSGITVGTAAGLVYLLLIYPLFHLTGWSIFAVALVIWLANVLISALGLMIDLKQPQLVGDDEQGVVRQNYNIYLTLIIAALIAVGLIGLGIYFFQVWQMPLTIIIGVITALLIVLSGLAYQLALQTGPKDLSLVEK